MGKRKNRQPDVMDDTNGSNNMHLSESSEDASIGETKCQHIPKALSFNHIRKALKTKGIETMCSACKSSKSYKNQMDEMEEFENVRQQLWICLKCANQACGRQLSEHAEQHFKTPMSDNHCLVMNTYNWNIYCYECDANVNPQCTKQLLEIFEFIKKSAHTITTPPQPPIPLPSIDGTALDVSITNNRTYKQPLLDNLTSVGGLVNFGNTCFFNSVLQCLAQTPYLVKILQDLQEPGEKFVLPGGPMKLPTENNDQNEEVHLPPIEDSLEGWGDFTSTLCKTLIEMQNSSNNSSRRPSELLNSFKKKTSQCMDGGQHDAHELLRHLLEFVRNEDLRRYQSIILNKVGLDEKQKRQNIDSVQKAQVKFYGNQAGARLLGPEPVFRGVLVSTLECSVCKHSSQRTEPFLDLSLPIMIDKPQPPIMKRKNCGVEDVDRMNVSNPSNPPPSKHQLKKEKKSARKNRKNRKSRNSLSNSNNNEESSLSNNSILEENQESNGDEINSEPDDESDADVEDNIETESASIPDVIESGYSSEKTTHPSPTEITTVSPLNSSVTKNTTFSEAETDECRSSPDNEHPVCESSIVHDVNKVTTGLSKVSMANNRRISSSRTRYPTVEGDISIQSCLNQFTAPELMTGNNKVGCEACTARENKKNQDNNISSKMVCNPSTKQYLISRVPPVLILHLKRFQSERFQSRYHPGFRKLTNHVTFPMVLDLAPVCKNHEKPKIYSLFGLVEHYGTLHSGHYVACVKARKPLDPNDRRWSFLPKKSSNDNEENKSCDESDIDQERAQDSTEHIEPPPGQWYHVSDSRVSLIDETEVLKREAYLLFYERIL